MKRLLSFVLAILLCLSGCAPVDTPAETESESPETQYSEAATAPVESEEAVSETGPTESDTEEEPTMQIQVTDGTNTVVFQLNDTTPAKSLYEMLPLEVEVENYSNNEKIFYPPQEVEASGGIEGDCNAGAIALFSPWGNVVMYYGPASAYPGLYVLGEAIEGADLIGNLSGTIQVTARRTD